MDSLKYNGEFITREIFCSLVAIDGRMAKMNQDERNDLVKQMYKNTQKYLMNYGIPVPLKMGHNDSDQMMRGFVQDLYLKKKNYTDKEGKKVPYYVISAKMFMYKDFYKLWHTGRLPGISIEGAYEGSLHNGDRFGAHIEAVTFNGTSPVAQPWLNNPNFRKHDNFNNYKCMTFQFGKEKKYSIKEFQLMAIPTKDELLTAIIGLVEDMYKGADPAVTEPPAEEPPPEEMQKEGEEEKPEYKCKDEYVAEWDKLSEKNKIPKTAREHFLKVASGQGLEFAKDLFENHMSIPKPPGEANYTSNNEIGDKNNITAFDKARYIVENGLDKVVDLRLIEKYKKGGK